MIHRTWNKYLDMLSAIAEKHDGTIHDSRCGKVWDPGQAVCAEAFGPQWMRSDEFRRVDESVVDGLIAAAQRLIDGECDWVSSNPNPGDAGGR